MSERKANAIDKYNLILAVIVSVSVIFVFNNLKNSFKNQTNQNQNYQTFLGSADLEADLKLRQYSDKRGLLENSGTDTTPPFVVENNANPANNPSNFPQSSANAPKKNVVKNNVPKSIVKPSASKSKIADNIITNPNIVSVPYSGLSAVEIPKNTGFDIGKPGNTEAIADNPKNYAPTPISTPVTDASKNNIVVTAAVSPISPNCDLALALTSDLATAKQGDSLNYAMNLKNQGASPCINASISMYYSDNEKFISANPKASSSNYYWNIGKLASGATKSFTIVTQAQNNISSDISTEACASADDARDSCMTNHVTISTTSSLAPSPVPLPTSPIPPPTPLPVPAPQPPAAIGGLSNIQEYGTWVWVSPLQMTHSYRDSIIKSAKENGINTFYVTIDDYLDIYGLTDAKVKLTKENIYSQALQDLINDAKAQGISVFAEAGWRDWAESGQTYKPFAIIDYVMKYNSTYPNSKLLGLQYDVEPYLLPSYNDNKATLLSHFISLIDNSVLRLGNSDLQFSIVIPHFYDDQNHWTPIINYNGLANYTFNHLLNIMDKRPGSSINLMAYRNFAEGDNGTIQLSNAEVSEASDGTHPTKIIVSQETGNVQPSYVTFYGLSKDYYIKQVGIIKDAFKNMSAFGGIGVHYVDPFLQLK